MGKNIRRGGDSRSERLRGKIRELFKEIRKKDQEIQILKKENDRLRSSPIVRTKEPIKEEKICDSCGKGILSEIEITKREGPPIVFLHCSLCDYKIKKK